MNNKIIILTVIFIIGLLPGYAQATIISRGLMEIMEALTKTGAKKSAVKGGMRLLNG